MGTQAYRFELIAEKLNEAGKLDFPEDARQTLTCFFGNDVDSISIKVKVRTKSDFDADSLISTCIL